MNYIRKMETEFVLTVKFRNEEAYCEKTVKRVVSAFIGMGVAVSNVILWQRVGVVKEVLYNPATDSQIVTIEDFIIQEDADSESFDHLINLLDADGWVVTKRPID